MVHAITGVINAVSPHVLRHTAAMELLEVLLPSTEIPTAYELLNAFL
jgi:integrase